MRCQRCFRLLLTIVLALQTMMCASQRLDAHHADAKLPYNDKFEIGLTMTYKLAKISMTTDHDFGLRGGAVDATYWLNTSKRFGVALNVNGETSTNIEPKINLNQITFVAGPRVVLARSNRNMLRVYAEALAGSVYAFDSVFPTSGVPKSSATSVALQTGGGIDLKPRKYFGIRLLEVDYIMTHLPNNADTYQGDLRIASGLILRF